MKPRLTRLIVPTALLASMTAGELSGQEVPTVTGPDAAALWVWPATTIEKDPSIRAIRHLPARANGSGTAQTIITASLGSALGLNLSAPLKKHPRFAHLGQPFAPIGESREAEEASDGELSLPLALQKAVRSTGRGTKPSSEAGKTLQKMGMGIARNATAMRPEPA